MCLHGHHWCTTKCEHWSTGACRQSWCCSLASFRYSNLISLHIETYYISPVYVSVYTTYLHFWKRFGFDKTCGCTQQLFMFILESRKWQWWMRPRRMQHLHWSNWFLTFMLVSLNNFACVRNNSSMLCNRSHRYFFGTRFKHIYTCRYLCVCMATVWAFPMKAFTGNLWKQWHICHMLGIQIPRPRTWKSQILKLT